MIQPEKAQDTGNYLAKVAEENPTDFGFLRLDLDNDLLNKAIKKFVIDEILNSCTPSAREWLCKNTSIANIKDGHDLIKDWPLLWQILRKSGEFTSVELQTDHDYVAMAVLKRDYKCVAYSNDEEEGRALALAALVAHKVNRKMIEEL